MKSKFLISSALSFGFKTVLDRFFLFLLSVALLCSMSFGYLLLLGIVDASFWTNNFFVLLLSMQQMFNGAFGLLCSSSFDFLTTLSCYVPDDASNIITTLTSSRLHVDQYSLETIFLWLIPTAIFFKFLALTVQVFWIKIGLAVYQNQEINWASMQHYIYLVPSLFVVNLVTSFCMNLGFFIFAIIGMYIWYRLSLATYFLIDKQLSIFNSLQLSWSVTRGLVWNLFGLSCVFGMMEYIMVFFPLLSLFLVPYKIMVYVSVYQQIIGNK